MIFNDFLYIAFLHDPTLFLLNFTGSQCSKQQEKHIKNTFENLLFFTNIVSNKLKDLWKWHQKWSSKWEFFWGVGALGRSWSLWRRNSFLTRRNDDTVLQKWPKEFKIAPKINPSVQNWMKPKSISNAAPCLQNASKSYKILANSFQHKSSGCVLLIRDLIPIRSGGGGPRAKVKKKIERV